MGMEKAAARDGLDPAEEGEVYVAGTLGLVPRQGCGETLGDPRAGAHGGGCVARRLSLSRALGMLIAENRGRWAAGWVGTWTKWHLSPVHADGREVQLPWKAGSSSQSHT